MQFKNKDININLKNGVLYFTFPLFEKQRNLKHCFSSRIGGVSDGIFKSMNLNAGRGDDPEKVNENIKIICEATSIDKNSLVAGAQTHSVNVRQVSLKHKGIGIYKSKDKTDVDALITNEKNLTLVTFHADCVPIYFYDTKNKAIGLAHAGWRGTVNEIVKEVLNSMNKAFNTQGEDIIAAIGPSIGQCCFEVKEDVATKFYALKYLKTENFVKKTNYDKFYINLWEVNKQILLNCGVKPSNIVVSNICTSCYSELLFSHRKSKGKRGTMVAMLCLVD